MLGSHLLSLIYCLDIARCRKILDSELWRVFRDDREIRFGALAVDTATRLRDIETLG